MEDMNADFQAWIKRRERKEKIDKVKLKIKSGLKDATEWMVKNPEATLVIVSTVSVVCKGLIKHMSMKNNNRVEINQKKLYWYDNSLGHYWELKRPLTTQECLEVDRRKKNGERLSYILMGMNVLK